MGSDEDLGSVDDELVGGVPMCFAGHTAQKNEELVEEADLRTVSARTEALKEEGGDVTFLWIVAKKPR
jgi:hypothetical protein